MGQTKEQRVIKQVVGKPTIQKFTPIATDMFLPNHSGIASHPEFIKNTSKINLVTANPATAEEGALILNTTNHSIYVYYLGEWRLLHALTIADEFLLLEIGDFILLEIGDKIILE